MNTSSLRNLLNWFLMRHTQGAICVVGQHLKIVSDTLCLASVIFLPFPTGFLKSKHLSDRLHNEPRVSNSPGRGFLDTDVAKMI